MENNEADIDRNRNEIAVDETDGNTDEQEIVPLVKQENTRKTKVGTKIDDASLGTKATRRTLLLAVATVPLLLVMLLWYRHSKNENTMTKTETTSAIVEKISSSTIDNSSPDNSALETMTLEPTYTSTLTATFAPTITPTITKTQPISHATISRPPQPQFVFMVQYHKTGHEITEQYIRSVHSVMEAKRQENTIVKVDTQLRHYFFVKRGHDPSTGCPLRPPPPPPEQIKKWRAKRKKAKKKKAKQTKNSSNKKRQVVRNLQEQLQTNDHDRKDYNIRDKDNTMTRNMPVQQQQPQLEAQPFRTSPSVIHLKQIAAPDFLCTLDSHQVFSDNVLNEFETLFGEDDYKEEIEKHEYYETEIDDDDEDILQRALPPRVKLIHMLRDPFDMAISNYLFHSQDPPPEKWVIRSNGIDYYPCSVRDDFLTRVAPNFTTNQNTTPESGAVNIYNTTLITPSNIKDLEMACHSLMLNNETQKPYRHYFEALTKLTPFQGLQLATIQMLISRGGAGTDLVRMVNNALRLREWQSDREQKHGEQPSSLVLTLLTDPDWSNYERTLDRVTEFWLRDLRVIPDDVKVDGDTNPRIPEDVLTDAKNNITAQVRSEALRHRAKAMSKSNHNHFTKDKLSSQDRTNLLRSLQTNDLLGPILTNLQSIVLDVWCRDHPDRTESADVDRRCNHSNDDAHE